MGAYLTDKQIYDLNNAMTANQNAQVGSLLDGLSASQTIFVESFGELAGHHDITAGEIASGSVVLFSTSGSTIVGYSASVKRGAGYVTDGLTKTVSGSALTLSGADFETGDIVYYFIL